VTRIVCFIIAINQSQCGDALELMFTSVISSIVAQKEEVMHMLLLRLVFLRADFSNISLVTLTKNSFSFRRD